MTGHMVEQSWAALVGTWPAMVEHQYTPHRRHLDFYSSPSKASVLPDLVRLAPSGSLATVHLEFRRSCPLLPQELPALREESRDRESVSPWTGAGEGWWSVTRVVVAKWIVGQRELV